jgi:hypothetical protein
MPIPTKFDGDLAKVENAASLITLSLRTMKHSTPSRDLPRMRDTLWERLQAFAELVQGVARDIGP